MLKKKKEDSRMHSKPLKLTNFYKSTIVIQDLNMHPN